MLLIYCSLSVEEFEHFSSLSCLSKPVTTTHCLCCVYRLFVDRHVFRNDTYPMTHEYVNWYSETISGER